MAQLVRSIVALQCNCTFHLFSRSCAGLGLLLGVIGKSNMPRVCVFLPREIVNNQGPLFSELRKPLIEDLIISRYARRDSVVAGMAQAVRRPVQC